jgi:general secretion pathway protein F
VARFVFEAVDGDGAVVRGHLEAPVRSVAIEQLLSAGQTPLVLKEKGGRPGRLPDFAGLPEFGGGDLLAVVRELSSLLKAGLPVERALVLLQNLGGSRRRSLRVAQMLERVRAGESLSQALRILIPSGSSHIEHLVAAGEASGHLPAVMARLANNLQRAKLLRERVISALTYPAFLVCTMVVVLWLIFTTVLPRLVPLFSEARAGLPLPTRILLVISQFLQSYGALLLVAAGLLTFTAIYALRQAPVRLSFDRFLYTTPLLLRIASEYESARFCRNLETLLAGGLSLDRALSAARSASANRWFCERTAKIQEAAEQGAALKTAFASAAALPAIVVEFAAVGEETGRLATMMGEGADLLERDVEVRLDRLTALILPIATLAMGLLVAGVMAGVVTGLLAVNDLAH